MKFGFLMLAVVLAGGCGTDGWFDPFVIEDMTGTDGKTSDGPMNSGSQDAGNDGGVLSGVKEFLLPCSFGRGSSINYEAIMKVRNVRFEYKIDGACFKSGQNGFVLSFDNIPQDLNGTTQCQFIDAMTRKCNINTKTNEDIKFSISCGSESQCTATISNLTITS